MESTIRYCFYPLTVFVSNDFIICIVSCSIHSVDIQVSLLVISLQSISSQFFSRNDNNNNNKYVIYVFS